MTVLPNRTGKRPWTGIGSALAVCAALVQSQAAADSMPTTVFYDAHIFTAEHNHPYAEALAIRGDRIVAVGTREAVERAAGPGARRVDLKERFLMPGMIDAHAHPIDGGLTLLRARFPDTQDSVPALVAFVSDLAAKHSSRVGDTLVVYDIDIGYWTHAAEIDAALSSGPFAHLPIVLYGSDGHTAWANRLARTRAGITAAYLRKLPHDQQRYYGFDDSFNPNGFAVDTGEAKIDASLPAESADAMRDAGRAAVKYMNGLGITGWLDAAAAGALMGVTPLRADQPGRTLPVYQELALSGELTAHVVAYPVVRPNAGLQQIDAVEALRDQYKNIPDFTIPGLKVFADGVVEIPSQTAAMTQPYRNTGRTAPLLFDPVKFNALVAEADRRGLIVHVHAIGDLAVRAALDGFAAARQANPSGTLPHTLTHAQFVDPKDIPRFADLRVIAALQLLWAVADQSTNEQVKPYVDPEIYPWMYPARSMLETGAEIAGASDWPVSSANPFEAIYQAETRSGPQGVLNADQRMPRVAMLYAYTRNAAHVLNQLDQIGSLAPGKLADLVLLDRDVLTVGAEELKDTQVVWTMFKGKIVYGTAP
jgi:predicted amidohydrolase YtcJ